MSNKKTRDHQESPCITGALEPDSHVSATLKPSRNLHILTLLFKVAEAEMITIPSHPGHGNTTLQPYSDSIVIFTTFGQLTFVTMKADLNWSELRGLHTPQNESGFICSVFCAKFKEMVENLTQHSGFHSQISSYIYLLSFQKRGLPHGHLIMKISTESILGNFFRFPASPKEDPDRFQDLSTADEVVPQFNKALLMQKDAGK